MNWRRANDDAFGDAAAIRAAVDAGDEDALRAALRAAEERSEGGTDETYSAMLVTYLGIDGIEGVLGAIDRVRHSTMPERGEQEDLIDPMAVLFGAATRSQSPEVMDIAYELLLAALHDTLDRHDAYGEVMADETGRANLADLLSAGTADPWFTAEAADTLLNLPGPPTDDGDERHLVIALDALARNGQAAHFYTTAADGALRPLEERLDQLLHPTHQTVGVYPGGISRDSDEWWAESEAMAERSADVLQAGLADWPARAGDPALTPAVANAEADAAAAAMAHIARLLPDASAPNGITGEASVLTDRVASITATTWMQDRLVRGAALGTDGDIDGPPGAPISMQELVDLHKVLIDAGGDAAETLRTGVVAYTDHQVAAVVADGFDNVEELAAGTTSTPDINGNHLPDLAAAGASIAALAEAHQQLSDDAGAAEAQANGWFDAASGSVFRGIGTVFTPVAVGAPLLTEALGEIVHGTPDVDGTVDSQQVRLSTGALLGDTDLLIALDPRFDGLDAEARRALAQHVTDSVFDAVTDGRVDADQ